MKRLVQIARAQLQDWFKIEEATRPSKCHICGETIEKGELKVKASLGSGFYPHNYHLNEFVQVFAVTIRRLAETLSKLQVQAT